MPTAKVSIAIDEKKLRLAKAAAKAEGLSLSAFISRGVDLELASADRRNAARELIDAWGPDAVPSARERAEFRRRMTRAKRRGRRAA